MNELIPVYRGNPETLKPIFLIFLLAILIPESLPAQDPYCPTCRKKDAQKPYITITAGYVPNPEYNAIKVNLSVNNIFYKRFGLYTSFEKSRHTPYFSNIIGGTATIFRTIYIFGGLDWFTHHQGVIPDRSIMKARKELGLAFSIFTYGFVRYGYSFQIGHSFSIGMKMPIEKIKRLFYKRI